MNVKTVESNSVIQIVIVLIINKDHNLSNANKLFLKFLVNAILKTTAVL